MAGVAGVVEAVIETDAGETPYRRAGHGPTVLLLADRDGLFEALASAFRVIQPLRAPASGDAQWDPWLCGVVDGLGLERFLVVADPGAVPAARRLAALDDQRVAAVVEAGTIAGTRAAIGLAHGSIDD